MEINDGPAATLHGEAEHYTGDVWQDPLAAPDDGTGLSMQRVHFSPGAHTNWHRHPRGQVLTVLEGVGRIQARGDQVRVIRAGQTAICPGDEWHWHGAGPGTMMTMIGVQAADDDGRFVIWGDRVLYDES
jgi:quercetin dioxygenase-like cupin family protein